MVKPNDLKFQAYAMTDYAAKAELEKICRQLELINLSAARNLEEGIEEALTVHRPRGLLSTLL